MTLAILYGAEWMRADAQGMVSRPTIGMGASGSWCITGAVTRNNFGGVVRRWTLAEIQADPSAIPWKFKNGKQRTYVQDIDHGTLREWRTSHEIRKAVSP